MPLFIDNIKARIESGAVSARKNGDGFLITSKRFCPFSGAELEEEYETVTLQNVDVQKKQKEIQIKNLEDQNANLLRQIEINESEIKTHLESLPNFDILTEHLKEVEKNQAKAKKEKK